MMHGAALPTFLTGIPDGIEGTRATLEIMRRWVKQYRTDPMIRALAESIIQDVPEKDAVAEVDALRAWVRQNIRYTQDVNDVETLKTPTVTAQTGQGDCDDQSTLMATLAESIGYKTRFAAVGFIPDNFEHVFSEVLLGTRWVPAETTENVPLGWYPPGVMTRITVNI